ncbi:MAG: putative toxin-antitoxin system toxin component, PIN family [Selenomonadaceae bacterium]|nr:putative toxin-antitoxin system toxin component, PIN family [Selenomonadaceae bacterium]
MKVLFDTNVLVSFILNPKSVPGSAVMRAINRYEALVCQASVEELIDTFNNKFPQRLNYLNDFLNFILPKMKFIPVPDEEIPLEKKIRDIDDRLILRAAVNAEIDIIISGDKDLLESGVKDPAILTPFQFTMWNF